MTDEIKPLRLDPATDDVLLRVLDAARAHEPSSNELARLDARLAAALPPGSVPTASAVAPKLAANAALKIGAGAIVLALGGGAVWFATSSDPSAPAAIPVPVVSATQSEVVPSSSVPSIRVDALPAASTPLVPPVARSVQLSPVAPAPPEATLLARAHAELLRQSPAEALATANEHLRAYPHGLLAQEREVIAIESLVALGKRDEAQKRAAAFRVDYPGSSHAARIGRLLDEP